MKLWHSLCDDWKEEEEGLLKGYFGGGITSDLPFIWHSSIVWPGAFHWIV
jgi:hypothetical protein